MEDKHDEGFEKERRFKMILSQARCDCPVLKDRTVRRILAHVAPEFTEGLFDTRPCVRKLKYIGCGCAEPVCPHGPDFFEMGVIYESIDYNGGTYSIKGWEDGNRRIGSAFFEWVD